jgi:hypothetical protein
MLCAAYGGLALKDVQAGLKLFAKEGKLVERGGKFFYAESNKEVPAAAGLGAEELKLFLARGTEPDAKRWRQVEEGHAGFNVRLGVLYMFAPEARDTVRADYCFQRARARGARIAQVFLDVLN